MKGNQLRLSLQPYKYWVEIRDGDPDGLQLYLRHYSARNYLDGRARNRFVGPGERVVLITPELNALFVWRRFKSLDSQKGINCSIFRNESPRLSSEMIIEAERFAVKKWGATRAYTYVNDRKVRSANPGYCFRCAGWRRVGITKRARLIIFAKQLAVSSNQEEK